MMCHSRICCQLVSIGLCCGWINEMKVAWMQISRMHPRQRDCVPSIVNGHHRISVAIVVIADGCRQLV